MNFLITHRQIKMFSKTYRGYYSTAGIKSSIAILTFVGLCNNILLWEK